jgi:hypothetical protein
MSYFVVCHQARISSSCPENHPSLSIVFGKYCMELWELSNLASAFIFQAHPHRSIAVT